MTGTSHFFKRANQRGITVSMVDCVFEYGDYIGDRIILTKTKLKKIIGCAGSDRPTLMQILDKGGLTVVVNGDYILTAYRCNKTHLTC